MEEWNGESPQRLHLSSTPPYPPLGEVVWEEGGGEVGTDHLNCLLGELGGEVMETGEEELPPPQEWAGEGGGRGGKAPQKGEKEEKGEGGGEV